MEPLEWSPFDPAFRNDPYPSLRWLREHDPVHRIGSLALDGLPRAE